MNLIDFKIQNQNQIVRSTAKTCAFSANVRMEQFKISGQF